MLLLLEFARRPAPQAEAARANVDILIKKNKADLDLECKFP